MISPTGSNIIRVDSMGDGHYGSRRGPDRKHTGSDYEGIVGQPVVAPISGLVVRVARPYSDQPFLGLVIKGRDMTVKMFYFSPLEEIIGASISEGMVIGHMQDIRTMHGPDMKPHIHLEITDVSKIPEDWIK